MGMDSITSMTRGENLLISPPPSQAKCEPLSQTKQTQALKHSGHILLLLPFLCSSGFGFSYFCGFQIYIPKSQLTPKFHFRISSWLRDIFTHTPLRGNSKGDMFTNMSSLSRSPSLLKDTTLQPDTSEVPPHPSTFLAPPHPIHSAI